jgi:hypothetical protein
LASDRAEEEEGFVRGFHGIPDAEKLNAMSFAELASLLSSCEKDSPKFHVVERELKKHLAKDQAEINRPNIRLGAYIGGGFGLAGVVLGAVLTNLNDSVASKQVSPPSPVQQIPQSNLKIQPSSINVQPSNPSAVQGAIPPTPAQGNTQPSKP